MPFDRMHVTRSSRIMLPFYVLFDLALGWTWVAQDAERTNASLQALRGVWPIAGTSVVLFVCAALLIVSLVLKRRALCGFTLMLGSLTYFALAVIFCLPLQLSWDWGALPFLHLGDSGASLSAPYWPVVPAVAHLASMITILFEETRESGVA